MKQYPIEVRDVDGRTLGSIKRALRAEQIGNFNPLFCRFHNDPRVLVRSDDGDVSDPFRREENYRLYIVAKN